jgi:hypothetical protein
MDPEVSLPHLQVPTACPSPESHFDYINWLRVLTPACHLPIVTSLQKTVEALRGVATSWQECAIHSVPPAHRSNFFFHTN